MLRKSCHGPAVHAAGQMLCQVLLTLIRLAHAQLQQSANIPGILCSCVLLLLRSLFPLTATHICASVHLYAAFLQSTGMLYCAQVTAHGEVYEMTNFVSLLLQHCC
jgi:hypothetical protein